MTVLHPGRRKTPPAAPWERDRAEFAALLERLGSDDAHTRENARRDLESVPYEDAVWHLAALWPGEEQTRRRRMPWVHFLIRLTALGFLLKIAFFILVRPEADQWILPRLFLTVIVGFCWIAALTFPHTSRRQKGMGRAMTAFPDVRLTGAFVDALGRTPFASLLGQEERDTVRAKLVDLLPRHRQSDLPPLDAHQRKILLGEVRAVTKRLRRKGDHRDEMPDDEARFLVATLDALGWEAVRGGPAPAGDAGVRAAQRDVDNMAQALGAVPDAERVYTLRRVRDAAEECRVRLRL